MNNSSSFEGVSVPKTLSQYVYIHLKDAIISNELQARERIDEKIITEKFQISRTPVREAINRLAGEGFITIDQHRDAHVRELTLAELQEIAQVLGLLDGHALASILDRLRPADLSALEKMTAKLEKYFQEESLNKFYQTNFAIHEKLWSFLPPGYLYTTLKIGASHMQRYCLNAEMPHSHEEMLKHSSKHHQWLMQSLKTKDAKGLSTLMRQHWSPDL
ncbi:MAG: GntR family transcriptional regulator [Candidatus Aminicenantes bacterium]|nr:GntR family transcriptional regulator [Candidatus Aminicenantes bacterium]